MMMLRNSERQSFKQCRWRWSQSYLAGLQAAEAPAALRFGDLVHQALAAYYKKGRRRGPRPARTFERLYHEQADALRGRGFDVFSDDKWVDALELGVGMLDGYVARFAAEDSEFEVVASEMTFKRVVRTPGTFGRRPIKVRIVGTLDGVWRHLPTGRLIFKEFKTAAAIKLDGLSMDEQASLYYTYGPQVLRRRGLLAEDEDIREIMYTFLRKAIPNPDKRTDAEGRVLNKDGSVSKQQPAPYFARVPVYRDAAERERLHERVCAEAHEIADARAGKMAIIKNPGPLHMPNCLGCFAREWCEVDEAGGDAAAVRDQLTIPWDAYAAHELPERR